MLDVKILGDLEMDDVNTKLCVDELEEDADVVQPLYDFVLKHIDWGEDEMVQKYLENIE